MCRATGDCKWCHRSRRCFHERPRLQLSTVHHQLSSATGGDADPRSHSGRARYVLLSHHNHIRLMTPNPKASCRSCIAYYSRVPCRSCIAHNSICYTDLRLPLDIFVLREPARIPLSHCLSNEYSSHNRQSARPTSSTYHAQQRTGAGKNL